MHLRMKLWIWNFCASGAYRMKWPKMTWGSLLVRPWEPWICEFIFVHMLECRVASLGLIAHACQVQITSVVLPLLQPSYCSFRAKQVAMNAYVCNRILVFSWDMCVHKKIACLVQILDVNLRFGSACLQRLIARFRPFPYIFPRHDPCDSKFARGPMACPCCQLQRRWELCIAPDQERATQREYHGGHFPWSFKVKEISATGTSQVRGRSWDPKSLETPIHVIYLVISFGGLMFLFFIW